MSERVRRIALTLSSSAGRPVSTSEILNAIAKADIDMSGYHGSFVSDTLAKGYIRFGDDAWWPPDVVVPADVPHQHALLPRQVKARKEASVRLADLNAGRPNGDLREIDVRSRDVPRTPFASGA